MDIRASAELVEWVYARLERDEDIVVPLRKLWQEWRAAHAESQFNDFAAQVLADERIEEMHGVNHGEGLEWMNAEELAEYLDEMQDLGFFTGPRAKLKAREITLEHIVQMLKKHNDRTEWALQQARATLPQAADERVEGALIDIQYKAQQLRRQLREVGLEAAEPEQDTATGALQDVHISD